ncbi:MAG: hypothetical protein JWQ74_2128 [Marmoricola sp.]|nr:hypothetical protein [Marmoricola sp.]
MVPVTTAWLTAFIDVPPTLHGRTAAFWSTVTGSTLSNARGANGEFTTLVPPDGDAYLRIQRIERGQAGVHLDVHSPEADFEPGRSPGGFAFCDVWGEEDARPVPRIWAGGHTSLVDQVTLDIAPAAYEEECAFWVAKTGWELAETSRPELRTLVRPSGQPLRVVLQRLDDASDTFGSAQVRAHLDIATSDRALETGRHREFGATVLRVRERWTVMCDPAGTPYCITDRDPYTGLLA